MLTDTQVTAIRSRFPIFKKKIHLNSCSQGALSDSVEAAVKAHLETWHTFGSPWEMWVEKYEELRRTFAGMIGAHPDEVAIVTSVSSGLSSIASALDFRRRRKVVLGEFEFPTMGHVWLAQRPRGAEVQWVEARGQEIPLSHYERAIDRDTLLVGLTGLCFANGYRSDVQGVRRLARDAGALLILDDYQDCGTRPIDVKALDVDVYVTGTLKYLLGPPGLAFMYVKRELIESLVPTTNGWYTQENPFTYDPKVLTPAHTARRFESGSPAIPNVYAVSGGLEILQPIGLDNVAGHIGRLTRALLEGARGMGLQVKTPPDSVGPLVVFPSRDVGELVKKLANDGLVVSSRHDGLRVSFHVYNTLDDVHAVLEALSRHADLLVRDQAAATAAGR